MTRLFFSILCLFSISSFAREPDIEMLIENLGNESFRVREEAQDELSRLGFSILPFLEKARESDDPEITERSLRLFSLIREKMLESISDPDLLKVLRFYPSANKEQKRLLIRHICESDRFKGGEGLEFLLYYLYLEDDPKVRFCAVGFMIASPPNTRHFSNIWYEKISDFFEMNSDPKNRELRFLADYSKLRKDAHAKKIPDDFAIRLENWSEELWKYLSDPNFTDIGNESDFEILLAYALADLQDISGSIEKLKETLAKIDEMASVKNRTDYARSKIIGLAPSGSLHLNEPPFHNHSHFEAGLQLFARNRLKWAERQFRSLSKKKLQLHRDANYRLACLLYEKGELEEAIELLGTLVSDFEAKKYNNLFWTGLPEVKDKQLFYSALAEYEKGNHKKAVELLHSRELAFSNRKEFVDYNVDSLVLLSKMRDEEKKNGRSPDLLILAAEGAIQYEINISIEKKRTLNNRFKIFPNDRLDDHRNDLAKLLGGTGKNAREAIRIAERLLEKSPENPKYLETLSDAYYSNSQFLEAMKFLELAIENAPEYKRLQKKLLFLRRQRAGSVTK